MAKSKRSRSSSQTHSKQKKERMEKGEQAAREASQEASSASADTPKSEKQESGSQEQTPSASTSEDAPAEQATVQEQVPDDATEQVADEVAQETEERSTDRAQTSAEAEPSQEPPILVVGIGSSAGGLAALETFFEQMPVNSGMAFVVISHHPGDHVSLLPELLGKCTNMAIKTVEEGMRVQPNTVYINPGHQNLEIYQGCFYVMEEAQGKGQRFPIDYFFRSLANDQKSQSVGIVLSGTGTDGTLGLQAIKQESGLTITQKPDTAEYPGMPQNAIDNEAVDYILPVEQMPQQLFAYAQMPRRELLESFTKSSSWPQFPDVLKKIFILLRSRTGHDFSAYKVNTLRRRIERRMNVHQLGEPEMYARFLQENPHEIDLLFKELLIGVTSFFRDPEAFEDLRNTILPPILTSLSQEDTYRVWVPGCSSGEEAYSLAIILQECIESTPYRPNVQIFATDLDGEAINKARTGVFPASIAADISPQRLKRFFHRKDHIYRIHKEIREMVIFAPHNLLSDPPFTRLDFVSCRNLLIYLDAPLQKELLPLFHYVLRSDGLLFLGTSESIGSFGDLFQVVSKKWKIFRRKPSTVEPYVRQGFPSLTSGLERAPAQAQGSTPKTASVDIASQVNQLLLDRYTPPTVIVNERGDLIYIHGRTGNFLEPPVGKAHMNILAMAREGLEMHLAAALHRASSQNTEAVVRGTRVKTNGDYKLVDLVVSRINEPKALRGLLMVSFESLREISADDKPNADLNATIDQNVLAQELRYTKDHLQSTIEELETANEELKSTNEELQSTNEELQSTNEELETSKEEMQSLNEELQTVNAELQSKLDELTQTKDDMENLLNSTDIATIYLDNQFHIKRFTAQARKVIHLIPSDVGRPISDIVSKLKYDNWVADAEKVLRTLQFKEMEVETKSGTRYLMRILPYRTAENVIDGLVITFVDIDRLERAEAVMHGIRFTRSIAKSIQQPLLVLDTELRVVIANPAFTKTFQLDPEETEGSLFVTLGQGQWNIPALQHFLKETITSQQTLNDYQIEIDIPTIGHKVFLINARKLEEQEVASYIIVTFKDITQGEMNP